LISISNFNEMTSAYQEEELQEEEELLCVSKNDFIVVSKASHISSLNLLISTLLDETR
jgi:hypothetical protein